MHHFHYKDGVLHAEDVSLARLAAEVGTPFYCYSTATLQRHYRVLTEAFAGQDALICFAVKANSNQAVLRTLAKLGAGMDVVSEGELRRALAAGVPAAKIIFAGVGKTREEMAFALEQGILGFNVESEPELRALSEVAEGIGHDGARRAARQSGRRRQDARQDLHRQGGEQVRHPVRASEAALRASRQVARHRRRRHPHAHREPDHRSRAVPQCLPADARSWPKSCSPTGTSSSTST